MATETHPKVTKLEPICNCYPGYVPVDARPETGPMQFGDDWPGVFIRGDNAMHFALNLKALLQSGVSAELWPAEAVLTGLVNTLASCCTNAELREQMTMPPFSARESKP